jgi:hypothetical protein
LSAIRISRASVNSAAPKAKGDHKQNADELFVPDSHKGVGECQYDEHGCADAAADGKVDRVVHEPRAVFQARNIGLEASPRGIVVGYRVQAADPTDDAAHPGDQDGNKGGYRAERRKAGAVACEMTGESWLRSVTSGCM